MLQKFGRLGPSSMFAMIMVFLLQICLSSTDFGLDPDFPELVAGRFSHVAVDFDSCENSGGVALVVLFPNGPKEVVAWWFSAIL